MGSRSLLGWRSKQCIWSTTDNGVLMLSGHFILKTSFGYDSLWSCLLPHVPWFTFSPPGSTKGNWRVGGRRRKNYSSPFPSPLQLWMWLCANIYSPNDLQSLRLGSSFQLQFLSPNHESPGMGLHPVSIHHLLCETPEFLFLLLITYI